MDSGIDIKSTIIIASIVVLILSGLNFVIKKYGILAIKNTKHLKNLQRAILSLNILLLLGTVGYIVITGLAISNIGLQTTVNQGDDIVKTERGDIFKLKYTTTNFPDDQTDVSVFDKNNNSLEYYHLEDDYVRPNILLKIDSLSIRCYEVVNGLLIYSFDGGNFKGIRRSQIDNEYLTKNSPDLINLSKTMVLKKDWNLVEFFGNFLLKSGDGDIRKTLERYASANFTQEELEINRSSDIKKEDMITFAKQVLEKR